MRVSLPYALIAMGFVTCLMNILTLGSWWTQVRVQSDPAGRLVITGQPEQIDNPWGITAFKKVLFVTLCACVCVCVYIFGCKKVPASIIVS